MDTFDCILRKLFKSTKSTLQPPQLNFVFSDPPPLITVFTTIRIFEIIKKDYESII